MKMDDTIFWRTINTLNELGLCSQEQRVYAKNVEDAVLILSIINEVIESYDLREGNDKRK